MHTVTFKSTRDEELQARTIDQIMPKTLLQGKLRTRLGLSTEDLLKKPKPNQKEPKHTEGHGSEEN